MMVRISSTQQALANSCFGPGNVSIASLVIVRPSLHVLDQCDPRPGAAHKFLHPRCVGAADEGGDREVARCLGHSVNRQLACAGLSRTSRTAARGAPDRMGDAASMSCAENEET